MGSFNIKRINNHKVGGLDYFSIDPCSLKEFLRMPPIHDIDVNDTIELDVLLKNSFSKLKILKSKTERFNLPTSETFFSDENWKVLPMQLLEEELNSIKSLLNDIPIDSWHDHTRKMNTFSSVINEIRKSFSHEFCSIAWCKLFEILSLHNVIPRVTQEAARQMNEIKLNSVHVCEAPGAFISALNHYLKSTFNRVDWNWTATSLNPYYEGNVGSEGLLQDQIIVNSFNNWTFLEDNSGNIMNPQNIMSLKEEALKIKNIQLVTADGSIECGDSPAEQETTTSNLHYCEIMAALLVLDKGGSFVLKMFTFFKCNSISKLYLLSCLFEEVEVIKPAMSKSGNSEVYIVCRGYAGPNFLAQERLKLLYFVGQIPKDKAMFSFDTIPKEFLNRVIDCSVFFTACQVQVIQRNVKALALGKDIYHKMWYTKHVLAHNWLQMTQLTSLDYKHFIFHLKNSKKRYCFKNTKSNAFGGSYNDRVSRSQTRNQLSWKTHMSELESTIKLGFRYVKIIMDFPSINAVSAKWGKQVDYIKSSRFCPDNVLQLNQNLKQLIDYCYDSFEYDPKLSKNSLFRCSHLYLVSEINIKDGESQSQNKIQLEDSTPKKLCYNDGLTFEDLRSSDSRISRNYFQRLYDGLRNLVKGQDFFLCCYPLLTRLHFGIAILIANFFQIGRVHYEIQGKKEDQNYMCGISYQDFQGIDEGNQLWNTLKEFFMTCTTSNSSFQILEIVPVNILCRKKLCNIAMQYNSQLLLKNVQEKLAAAQSFFLF